MKRFSLAIFLMIFFICALASGTEEIKLTTIVPAVPTLRFGQWQRITSSFISVRQASTDGFVMAGFLGGGIVNLEGKTDSSSPPATTVANAYTSNAVNEKLYIMFPVRKDDYWVITYSETGTGGNDPELFWLPLEYI